MSNLSEKKLFLLDMDGTIYLDDELFDGTVDFLDYVKKIGGRYLFLTNNSSRGVDAYVQKMARLGIETTKEDFLTSTDATILYLKNNYPNAKVYAFGTTTFKDQLRQSSIRITDKLEDDIDLLLCGFDTELTFQKLEDSCILLGRGVPFIATNPDWVCRMLTTATGRKPLFIGKPQPEMALLAMERFGYEKSQTMMIGDRLYTDIASGINAGIDACFVLSGEGTMEDLETSEVKPTMIYDNIRAIYNALKA